MKVTVNLLEDPLTRAIARTSGIELRTGAVVWDALCENLPDLIGRPKDIRVTVNGVPADHDTRLASGNRVDVCVVPDGTVDVVLAVIAVASAVASYVLTPKIGGIRADTSSDPKERRFGFNRVSNDAFVGDIQQVVLGEHERLGGKIIAAVPVESADGNGNSTLKLLICYGHGELAQIGNQTTDVDGLESSALSGIWLQDQPISAFPGIKAWTRMGSSAQAVIPGFRDTETLREVGVGGVALVNTSGSERAGGSAGGEAYTYATSAAVHEAVIRMRFPAGLYALSDTGQIDSARVKYRARWRTTAGPGSWSTWKDVAVEQADQSEFFSSPRLELVAPGGSPAAFDIQVERVSVDAADATRSDKIIWDSVIEVQRGNNTYPGFALLALELTAGEQLSSVPSVSASIKGFKKVRIWDGTSSVDAPTFVQAYSNNPVWLAIEAATNTTWGAGWADTEFVWSDVIAAAAYADDSVARPVSGTRPRFACNIELRDAHSATDVIASILSTCRSQLVASGNVWRIVTDRPQSSPAEVFTDATVAVDDAGEARFTYTREFGTGGVTRANRMTCSFVNATADSKTDTLSFPAYGALWLATEPVKEDSIKLDGVTDPDQVASELLYRMKSLRFLTRTVSFVTTKPAVAVQPGERFDLAMSMPGWGSASGRVASGCTTSAVKLDRDVVLQAATSYTFTVVHEDGSVETKPVSSPAGTYAAGDAIALGSPLSVAPAIYEEFVVGKSGVAVKPFICTGVRLADTDKLEWEIEGIEYAADVFDDTASSVTLGDYSTLGDVLTPPGPVENLRAYERGDSTGQRVELAWTQQPADAHNTATFRIYRRRVGTTTWVIVPEPRVARRGAVIEITDRDVGYEFAVVAVSVGGASLSPYDVRVPKVSMVFGLASPPPDPPPGLGLTNTGGNTYTLSWTAVPGAVEYQVLFGGDTTALPNVGAEDCMVMLRTPNTSVAGLELPPGQACRFFVRSVGSSGRLSFTASTVNISSPATPPGESIAGTRTFTLASEGALSNLTWNGSTLRLELTSPTTPGIWTSPDVALSGIAMTEITFRPKTANDADDPALNTDPFQVPSLEADQWGVISIGPEVVGMLMPPWPDAVQTWKFEVSTFDGVVWSDWQTLAPCASVRTNLSKYRFRITMTRTKSPYRPALRGFVAVATR